MLPELEKILADIGSYYKRGLKKRYPPDPETEKQTAPATEAQSGPAQAEKDSLPPEEELSPDQQALLDQTPQEHKNLCLSALVGRMENLPQDDPEYKECSFLAHALKNGWLVDDIQLLRDIYASLSNTPSAYRPEANKILDQFASAKANKLSDRFEMLDITSWFLLNLGGAYPKYQKTKHSLIEHNRTKKIYPLEYPEDKDFEKTAGGKDPNKGVKYTDVFKNDESSEAYRNERDELARENTEYVFDEITERQRALEKETLFVPNAGQSWNKMTISASKAIGEVIGSSVYDEIGEMSRGKLSDRKVKLHHSMGTRHQKEGHDVLELEFAGSGGHDVQKFHKDRNGEIDDIKKLTEEEAKAKYGIKAKKPGSTKDEFDYIRYRERTIKLPEGKTATKMRYAFAGPTPDMPGILRGLINLGEYSIENSRKYAKHYGAEFLGPRFDKWLSGKEEPKPIHIDISGHSRGAVSAGQAAKYIDEWVQSYIDAHPDNPKAKELKKYVHYDLRLYDPVPGMITNWHLGSCDLRKIPNVNCTVFCSLGIEAPDFAFPMQHVKGAKKVILTMTDHAINTNKVDVSQHNTFGDRKKHAQGYYDAETGEMHRGSGLNELPDGVYIADEKYNLIRVTSYSQVKELFDTTYDKTSPQRVRARRIHKMVRDWFIENELEMSFPDEQTRMTEGIKNDMIQDKILKQNAKRLRSVKDEIENLRKLKQRNGGYSKEELLEQNKKLIKACREYMQETTMPPSGNTAYKVGLVSDTLSHTMRENNFLKKELSKEKNEVHEPDLDDKIRAQKERLEKKDGYLKRKQVAETKRLEQENKVLKLFADTAKKCSDTLAELDKTRVGKSASSSYDKFHKILEEGSKLGAQTSVSEMSDFLRRFSDASESYRNSHDSLVGPITGDGKKRLEKSVEMKTFGKDTAEELKKLTIGLGEKNTPIGLRIMDSSAKLEDIKNKQEQRKAAEAQPAVEAAGPSVQPAVSV